MFASVSRPRFVLVAIIIVAAAVRVFYFLEYASLPFINGPIADSLVYRTQAHAVLTGNFGHATLVSYSPLYGYFLALFGGGPHSLVWPAVVQLIMGCFNIVILYRACAQSFGARAGLVSAVLYAGYGIPLFYETKQLSETLALTLVIVSTGLFLSQRFRTGSWWTACLTGILMSLSVLARASLVFSW